ncbi:hypothetical protein [Yoonia sp. SS1-5]|uniref:Uncharacterized protein n=1 Tax=Yoonia rhodophyticola TaxID=3137370 RepID=A0AAN0M883_9RHOB
MLDGINKGPGAGQSVVTGGARPLSRRGAVVRDQAARKRRETAQAGRRDGADETTQGTRKVQSRSGSQDSANLGDRGNDARQQMQDFGEQPDGDQALAEALFGKQIEELTLEEQLLFDDILSQTLRKGGPRPRIISVPTASRAEIRKGTAPRNALPPGVDAAYVPGKNVIMVRQGLSPARQGAAIREEMGEWLGAQVSQRGLELAPGDVGARVAKVVRGGKLTQADFTPRKNDKAKVRLGGQTVTANARSSAQPDNEDAGTPLSADDRAKLLGLNLKDDPSDEKERLETGLNVLRPIVLPGNDTTDLPENLLTADLQNMDLSEGSDQFMEVDFNTPDEVRVEFQNEDGSWETAGVKPAGDPSGRTMIKLPEDGTTKIRVRNMTKGGKEVKLVPQALVPNEEGIVTRTYATDDNGGTVTIRVGDDRAALEETAEPFPESPDARVGEGLENLLKDKAEAVSEGREILGDSPIAWEDLESKLEAAGITLDGDIAGGANFHLVLQFLSGNKTLSASQFGALKEQGVIRIENGTFSIDLSKATPEQADRIVDNVFRIKEGQTLNDDVNALPEYDGQLLEYNLNKDLGLIDPKTMETIDEVYGDGDGVMNSVELKAALADGYVAFGPRQLERRTPPPPPAAPSGPVDDETVPGNAQYYDAGVASTATEDIPVEHRKLAVIETSRGTRSGTTGITEIQYQRKDGKWVTASRDTDQDGGFGPFQAPVIFDGRDGRPNIRAVYGKPGEEGTVYVEYRPVQNGDKLEYDMYSRTDSNFGRNVNDNIASVGVIKDGEYIEEEIEDGGQTSVGLIELLGTITDPAGTIDAFARTRVTVDALDPPSLYTGQEGTLINGDVIFSADANDTENFLNETNDIKHTRYEVQYKDENGDWKIGWARQGAEYSGTGDGVALTDGAGFIPHVNGEPPTVRLVVIRDENARSGAFFYEGKEFSLQDGQEGNDEYVVSVDSGLDPAGTDVWAPFNTSIKINSTYVEEVPGPVTDTPESPQTVDAGAIFEAAGVADTDTLSADALVKGLDTLGVSFDAGDGSYSASDAAQALEAINGGPLTLENLQGLMGDGRLSVSGGQWRLDPSKLNHTNRRAILADVLDSGMSGGEKFDTLKRLGIVETMDDLVLIDRKLGNGDGVLTGDEVRAIPLDIRITTDPTNGGVFEIYRTGLAQLPDPAPTATRLFAAAGLGPDDRISAGVLGDSLEKLGRTYAAPGEVTLDGAEALEVLEALNGGPMTRDQLQDHLDSGLLKIEGGSWHVDLSGLSNDQVFEMVGYILDNAPDGGADLLDEMGFSTAEQQDLDYAFGNNDGTLSSEELTAAREALGDDFLSASDSDSSSLLSSDFDDLSSIVDEVEKIEVDNFKDPAKLKKLMEHFGVNSIKGLRRALVIKGLEIGGGWPLARWRRPSLLSPSRRISRTTPTAPTQHPVEKITHQHPMAALLTLS